MNRPETNTIDRRQFLLEENNLRGVSSWVYYFPESSYCLKELLLSVGELW